MVLLTLRLELTSFCIHILRASFPHPIKEKPPRPAPRFFGPMLVQHPICVYELLWANGPTRVISLHWFWSGDDTEVKDQPICTLCRLWGMLTWGACSSRKVKSESSDLGFAIVSAGLHMGNLSFYIQKVCFIKYHLGCGLICHTSVKVI